MKKQKPIQRLNPACTGKEEIICGHYKKKAATSVDALNPEIHHAEVEARALAEIYERRMRRLDELSKEGQVVHVNITQVKMQPKVVDVFITNEEGKFRAAPMEVWYPCD